MFASQSGDHTISQSVIQSIRRSVSHSDSQSDRRTVRQLINQPFSQSGGRSVSQSVQSASCYPFLPLLPSLSLPLPLNRFPFQPVQSLGASECGNKPFILARNVFFLLQSASLPRPLKEAAAVQNVSRPQPHALTTFEICCLRPDSTPPRKTTGPKNSAEPIT